MSDQGISIVTQDGHRRGLILVTTAMVVLSFDALLIRLADVPIADILFWRGMFTAISLTGVLRIFHGRWVWQEMRAGGRIALGVAIGFGMTQTLFVSAVLTTRVANVVMILTAAPLFAAAFSGLFLREWVALRTWIAILVCIVGIAIVFGGSLEAGAWFGNGMSLAAALIVGAVFTALRHGPGMSRLAVLAVAGLLIALVGLPWATPMQITARSLAILALMGLVLKPLSQGLMTVATRYMPSVEVVVFLTIEAILSILLVWLFLGEEPPPHTLAGGGLVIITLVAHSWVALRRQRMHPPILEVDTVRDQQTH